MFKRTVVELARRHGMLASDDPIAAMGEDFIDLYCRHRAAKTAAFENPIGAREYDRYL